MGTGGMTIPLPQLSSTVFKKALTDNYVVCVGFQPQTGLNQHLIRSSSARNFYPGFKEFGILLTQTYKNGKYGSLVAEHHGLHADGPRFSAWHCQGKDPSSRYGQKYCLRALPISLKKLYHIDFVSISLSSSKLIGSSSQSTFLSIESFHWRCQTLNLGPSACNTFVLPQGYTSKNFPQGNRSSCYCHPSRISCRSSGRGPIRQWAGGGRLRDDSPP